MKIKLQIMCSAATFICSVQNNAQRRVIDEVQINSITTKNYCKTFEMNLWSIVWENVE